MKRFRAFCAIVTSALLVLSCSLVSAAEEDTEGKELEIRIQQDHPGVVGYDVTYNFNLYYGTEYDKEMLPVSDYTLSCAEEEIAIDGNKVTVPASFKDNTDVDGVKIYASYRGLTTYYLLMIKNWTLTFEDNFDGDSLDPEKWASNEGKYAEVQDLGGKTSAPSDDAATVEDGNLVLRILPAEGHNVTSFGEPIDVDFITPRVTTQDKFDQRFGLYMSSMKLPGGTTAGCNSAFWLLPASGGWGKTFFATQRYGRNAGFAVGEIDTIEYSPAWEPTQYQINTHWWDSLTYVKGGADFHVVVEDDTLGDGSYINVATVWTENSLYTYYNGELYDAIQNLEAYEGETAYMLYTVGAAGYGDTVQWAGSFTEDDLDDLVTYVDYCRAYK